MDYMARHGDKRTRPDQLVPGTLRVISVRMDYGTGDDAAAWATLEDGERAYVARYALGRDYHKVMRNRLQKLADRIAADIGPFGYRAFVDSAPVLERALARDAGLGWIGKHSCLINKDAGSWFFLGEIYTDLPLPVDTPASAHCGTCTRCIQVCPTGAIVAPYRVDARRCISYLTIELRESIPEELRPLVGNRVFGCDDCQLACPWNKFAVRSDESDFRVRHGLDQASLVELFAWSEEEFLRNTEGSAIRRTGYEGWLRNIAVAWAMPPARRRCCKRWLRAVTIPARWCASTWPGRWPATRIDPGVQRRARISASRARVTGSAGSVSPATAGNSSLAMRLPSSTPHWSKALMPQSTDCT